MLDLLDNAFDASFEYATQAGQNSQQHWSHEGTFKGRINISADKHKSDGGSGPVQTTGLTLMNNGCRPIKDLAEVLEVYRSTKGSGADSIGENGVGLKQGCATLSNMSFVLTRNKKQYSFGVIAKSLQKEEGCYLPSFVFESENLSGVRAEMEFLFSASEQSVGDCVKLYGGGCLTMGINRILRHYEKMTRGAHWSESDYMFCLVLHELKHGSEVIADNKDEWLPDSYEGQRNTAGRIGDDILAEELKGRAHSIMDKLLEELPVYYIHIPTSFDVRVNNCQVQFHHWQRRLVELSSFQLKIATKDPWIQAADWLDPVHSYPIRIYAGFDPTRLSVDQKSNAASLLIYSRQSGRLIKHEEDARGLLGLSSGGTSFCQGMTIIVDDFHGYLPLSPTKQDVAFGEQSNGEIHKKNLYAWVGALANMYYNFFLDRCANRKTLLTKNVKKHLVTVQQLQARDANSPRELGSSSYSTFEGIKWRKTQWHSIRVSGKNNIQQVQGPDTFLRIEEEEKNVDPMGRVATQQQQARVLSQQSAYGTLPSPASASIAHQSFSYVPPGQAASPALQQPLPYAAPSAVVSQPEATLPSIDIGQAGVFPPLQSGQTHVTTIQSEKTGTDNRETNFPPGNSFGPTLEASADEVNSSALATNSVRPCAVRSINSSDPMNGMETSMSCATPHIKKRKRSDLLAQGTGTAQDEIIILDSSEDDSAGARAEGVNQINNIQTSAASAKALAGDLPGQEGNLLNGDSSKSILFSSTNPEGQRGVAIINDATKSMTELTLQLQTQKEENLKSRKRERELAEEVQKLLNHIQSIQEVNNVKTQKLQEALLEKSNELELKRKNGDNLPGTVQLRTKHDKLKKRVKELKEALILSERHKAQLKERVDVITRENRTHQDTIAMLQRQLQQQVSNDDDDEDEVNDSEIPIVEEF